MVENYMKGKQHTSTKEITDSLTEDQKLSKTKETECQEAKDNEKSNSWKNLYLSII